MEENNGAELEEGEAFDSQEEEVGNNDSIDPDVALSYIDEKIQNVLGHFQREFEGGLSAENLGSKFGGYGSFLPTYQRSPSGLSRQSSPDVLTKSQNNLSTEGLSLSRNLRAPVTPMPPSRLKAAQSSTDTLHCATVPTGNPSVKLVKQEPRPCSDPVAEVPTKDGSLIKSGNTANQRPLKVRIKLGSGKSKKTNAALYCGLGLEDSPSTSLGSSSRESGGFPSISLGKKDESPDNILQVMTSLPFPYSDLISPLHESLLSLVKKDVFHKDNKPAQNVKANPGQSTVSVDHSVTVQENAMLSKVRKIKSEDRSERPVEVNNGHSDIFHNKMAFSPKKESNNEMLKAEASPHYNLGKRSLSSTGDINGEPRNMAAKVSEVFGEANNIKTERKLSSDSAKKVILKPVAALNYAAEVKSGQKSMIVKAGEHGASSSRTTAKVDLVENGVRKGEEMSVLPKDRRIVAKKEEEFDAGEAPSIERNVAGVPWQDERPRSERNKKSRASSSDDKAFLPGKDRLTSVAGITGKDKKRTIPDIPPSKKNPPKRLSGNRFTGLGNLADASESLNGELNHLEAPSAGRPRDAVSTYTAVENNAVLANSWDMNNNGVINSSYSGAPVRDAAATADVPTSEIVEENWVQCDSCNKWRLLPNGVMPDDLPDKWLCSMLDWLPGMNSCKIPEDKITRIMQGSMPLPGPESQYHSNGSVFAVPGNVQHLEQSPHNVGSAAANGRGKYKLGAKEMPKKQKADPVKNRSFNSINPPPAERISLRACDFRESKSHDLALGEKIRKHKDRNQNTGQGKQVEEKNKRKSDQFEFEASKRAKRDEISNGAKHGNSDIKVCRTDPSLGMPKLTLIKGKSHFNECGSAKERKHGVGGGRIILSVKNVSNQSSSLKKRKMVGSQDEQIESEAYRHPVQDRKLITKEETDDMSRKEKKSRLSDTVTRDFSSGDGGNGRSKIEGKAVTDFSGGLRNVLTDCVEEDRHPGKHRKQLPPKQATSSSSKVSGSQKSRINHEVQGSPVESVSSSPLRVMRSAKSLGPDIRTRRTAVNGVLPITDDFSKGSGGKINRKSKMPEPGNRHGVVTADYPQDGEFTVNHTSLGNGVYMKQSAAASLVQKNGDLSSVPNYKGRNHASDSDRDKVKTPVKDGKRETQHLNKDENNRSLVKPNHAPPLCEGQSHEREFSKQNKHAQRDEIAGNPYSDYGLESPSENICPDPNDRVGAAPVSVDATSAKMTILLHIEEAKPGTPSRASQLGQRTTCNGLPVDAAGNSDPTKVLSTRSKMDVASNCSEHLSSESNNVKDVLSSSPSRPNQSVQTAYSVLQEAEKLRDLADRLKDNFGFERKESYFEAALKFLQGASLLETGNGESSKYREMSPMQVYSTAAKLCESTAAEYERCQELAAAALAYKCMEVAYMRVVYNKSAGLNRDRHELQATLNQGESPSSSASDIDNLNNQAVTDRSNLSKGAASHAIGNHIAVTRNRTSFVRLLDFAQDVNLAMEASTKSQVAFAAARAIMEESQNKEHIITSLKKVIDFSFQDVDGVVRLVQLARKVITRLGFNGAKE